MSDPAAQRAKPRWWPALFFLALTAVAILGVQFIWDVHQQDKNVWTFLLCGVCFLCLLLWLMLLSRLPWRTRWLSLGVVALVHAVVLGLVRIKGVDGDLVPIVEWRWASAANPPPEAVGLEPVVGRGESSAAGSESWPQFLGPNRNCTVDGIRLETDWANHPPQERWRVPVGAGWSGFAVAGGLAVTQEQTAEREAVSCFDSLTGQRLWTHAYDARFATTIAGVGPRSTPAIDGDRVYAAGATGWLTCLDLRTGEVVWARNVFDEYDGTPPQWGFSVSPLLVGELVVLSAGGTDGRSLVALDKLTGETRWTGGHDSISYSSPVACTLGGHPQVVVFNMGSVAGHDPETGRLLWERPYDRKQVHVAAPLVWGDHRVLVSSGYGHGSELYEVEQDRQGGWSAELVWTSRRMKAKFTNLVRKDGFIYGLDDGILACISAETGKLQWKDGRYGHGQMILVGASLLVTTETGDLVLLDPSPDGHRELARLPVFAGKSWNPPALAGSHLFLRTDAEAVCLELAVVE